jgi:hypothetical protein
MKLKIENSLQTKNREVCSCEEPQILVFTVLFILFKMHHVMGGTTRLNHHHHVCTKLFQNNIFLYFILEKFIER